MSTVHYAHLERPARGTKAHWRHPSLLGPACSAASLDKTAVDPAAVPVQDRCTRPGCKERWETWQAGQGQVQP